MEWRPGDATYVVFADVLGFAEAVESLSKKDDEAFSEALSFVSGFEPRTPRDQKLYRQYTRFQETVSAGFERFGSAVQFGVPPQGWTALFSDSAFFATRHFLLAVQFAADTLVKLMRARVPARAGL